MEPASINWKKTESRYVKDELYEHFNAPKWVDLGNVKDAADNEDEKWFCRPDCSHPKTAEDFLQEKMVTPPKLKVKVARSVSNVLMPFSENNANNKNNNQRDGKLKRRGILLPQSSFDPNNSSSLNLSPKPITTKMRFQDDQENQNPNLASTAIIAKKAAIKSSAEKSKPERENVHTLPSATHLKSNLSAKNLFSGKDIMGQISEFYHEIKKLATVRKERPECYPLEPPEELDEETIDVSPESLSLLKQEVRSCPPTPQRFPSPLTLQSQSKVSPLKPFKPVALEKGALPEAKLQKNNNRTKDPVARTDENCSIMASAGIPQAKSLDMFWLFKPCTFWGDH